MGPPSPMGPFFFAAPRSVYKHVAPVCSQRDTLEALYRAVVDQGIAAGDFVTVDVGIFIKTMFGALNWVSLWYREDGRLSGMQIADEIASTFLRSLGAES